MYNFLRSLFSAVRENVRKLFWEFGPTKKRFASDPSLKSAHRISLFTTKNFADKDEVIMAGPLLRILLVLQLASQAARCKLGQFHTRVYRIRIQLCH